MATATTEPVRLPPGPRIPKTVQGIVFLTALCEVVPALSRRYGNTFTINLPVFGKTVVISDPVLVKDVFSTSSDLIERPTNPRPSIRPWIDVQPQRRRTPRAPQVGAPAVSREAGEKLRAHRRRRGDARNRELAGGPRVRNASVDEPPDPQRDPACRVRRRGTRAGRTSQRAAGHDHGWLPLHLLPSIVGRDFGRWSPGGRLLQYRRRIDAVIDSLIAKARADPALEERSDVLALLLQARYENGEPIPDRHIADELLTLVAAGHETTASQLAWTVERLRRHPQLLSRLADEVDAGGSELRQATIYEVQRTRSTIEASLRCAKKRIRLGDWVLPPGTNVMVNFQLAHESEENFPDADSFNPDRFVGASPKAFRWIPYGGGVNRCIGAGFANMEMDVALRTLLREFRFAPTDAPGERRHYRGVAIAPARGARAVVYRRTAAASGDRDSVSVADHGS